MRTPIAVTIAGFLRAGIYWRAHPEITFVAVYATVLLGELAILRTVGARLEARQLRPASWLVFLILGALLALAAPPMARAATLIYSNDVLGEIEPCGCRNNPQGGMLRKANLIQRQTDQSIVQLDGGDLLFPTLNIPEPLVEQSSLPIEELLDLSDGQWHRPNLPTASALWLRRPPRPA